MDRQEGGKKETVSLKLFVQGALITLTVISALSVLGEEEGMF